MDLKFYSAEYLEIILKLRVLARYDFSEKAREEHDELVKTIREGKDISNEERLRLYSEVYEEW